MKDGIVCARCHTLKPCTEYYHSRRSKTGLLGTCKACEVKKKQEWKASNPEKHRESMRKGKEKYRRQNPEKNATHNRNSRIKRKYAIGNCDYERMLLKQNGKSAICFQDEPGRRLAIDHNHINGSVRGLLCSRCNTGIGCFGDSIFILERAISYLSNTRKDSEKEAIAQADH